MPVTWLKVAIVIASTLGAHTPRRQVWAAGLVGVTLLGGHLAFIHGELTRGYDIVRAIKGGPDVVVQAQHLLADHQVLTEQIRLVLSGNAELRAALEVVPVNAVHFSNEGKFLMAFLGRSVRVLEGGIPGLQDVTHRLRTFQSALPRTAAVYIAVLPNNASIRQPGATEWKASLLERRPQEFVVEQVIYNMVLFRLAAGSGTNGSL